MSSRLYSKYLELKKADNTENTLYLFKSGIFFIFLEDDARIAADILSLKITNLNESVIKCGFPKNSLDKNINILKHCNYEVKIIENENNTAISTTDYRANENFSKIVSLLNNTDTNNLTVREAYELIDELKKLIS